MGYRSPFIATNLNEETVNRGVLVTLIQYGTHIAVKFMLSLLPYHRSLCCDRVLCDDNPHQIHSCSLSLPSSKYRFPPSGSSGKTERRYPTNRCPPNREVWHAPILEIMLKGGRLLGSAAVSRCSRKLLSAVNWCGGAWPGIPPIMDTICTT